MKTLTHAPIRLGLLSLSPIYYQVPLYQRLAADPRLRFTAMFASGDGVLRPADVGYGKPITWSGDQLSGYASLFLPGAARARGRRANPAVLRAVANGRFDVLWVHGYNHPTLQLGLWTQRALGRGVMVREEQTLIHPRGLLKTIAKEVALRLILGQGPALYLGTESARWLEHYGVLPERLIWAPYAVENDVLRADAQRIASSRDAVRRALGIRPDSGPVVLTVCRLVENKQPDALIRAFAALRARMSCTLLIVGAGPLEAKLRQQVAACGVADVVFGGFMNRDRISEVYAAADIFVLYSRMNETWGIVVNEAMNFGLPIVVSDRCGCARDLVRDGLNGYVVDAGRPDALTERLLTLASDEALRTAFGKESMEIIQRYSYDAAAAGVVRGAMLASGNARYEAPHVDRARDADP